MSLQYFEEKKSFYLNNKMSFYLFIAILCAITLCDAGRSEKKDYVIVQF